MPSSCFRWNRPDHHLDLRLLHVGRRGSQDIHPDSRHSTVWPERLFDDHLSLCPHSLCIRDLGPVPLWLGTTSILYVPSGSIHNGNYADILADRKTSWRHRESLRPGDADQVQHHRPILRNHGVNIRSNKLHHLHDFDLRIQEVGQVDSVDVVRLAIRDEPRFLDSHLRPV